MQKMQKMPKYYLTASLINAWIYGYDNFYELLTHKKTEPNKAMLKGIDFEEKAVKGEIEELKPYIDGAFYQVFTCKECEGYMLLGFIDLLKKDTIYDLKYVKTYDLGKYNKSIQHLIYLYCMDMQNFEYIIGCGDEVYFEKQPRNDELLKSTINKFINWLKLTNLYETYCENYSVERHRKEIEEYENYI